MIDLFALSKVELEKTREFILGYPWENRQAYAAWLAQTYYMVNHSTRLVALAGAYADLSRNDLHARFVDHSKEERGHQLIAISDIKNLGYTLEDFPCLYPSASMYQVQYYWIQFKGASSFFGYTMALETLAAEYGQELYRRVSTAHGEKCSKFLKCHAEDDVDHISKAFEQMKKLTAPEQALVKENLELSANIYRAMLTETRNVYGSNATLLKKVA